MRLGVIDFSEKHANIGTVVWATVHVETCITCSSQIVVVINSCAIASLSSHIAVVLGSLGFGVMPSATSYAFFLFRTAAIRVFHASQLPSLNFLIFGDEDNIPRWLLVWGATVTLDSGRGKRRLLNKEWQGFFEGHLQRAKGKGQRVFEGLLQRDVDAGGFRSKSLATIGCVRRYKGLTRERTLKSSTRTRRDPGRTE